MLWLSVGLGKSCIALTAIEDLLDQFQIKGALVVAPVKVIEAVWEQEAALWEHTQRLTFSMVRGTPKERLAALMRPADIYLVNYEQLTWMTKVLKEHWLGKERHLPFDMVVFDEISKMKNSTSKRCKAFTKILPHFKYRVGLTGTPASNGLIDLHGQYLMVDGGHRLGPNITGYRNRWFMQDMYTHKWSPRRNAKPEIEKRIADVTLEMSAEDYLELPPLVDIEHAVEMPDEVMAQYKEFEKEFYLDLGDDDEVEAFNAGAKSVKCRQLANGAVYTDESRETWSVLHNEKLDHLEELINELNGSPLLICYQFLHDKERIAERFPETVFLDRTDVATKVNDWNTGNVRILAGHPASMGHGLNLQYGGCHIAWFGLPWSLELYEQAIGRLLRNGQKSQSVFNHKFVVKGTVEDTMSNVVKQKGVTQRDLRDAIKRRGEILYANVSS